MPRRSNGFEVGSGLDHEFVEGLLRELEEKLGGKIDSLAVSLDNKMEQMEQRIADDKEEVKGIVRSLQEDVLGVKHEVVNGRSAYETATMDKLTSLEADLKVIRDLSGKLQPNSLPHNAAPSAGNTASVAKRRRMDNTRATLSKDDFRIRVGGRGVNGSPPASLEPPVSEVHVETAAHLRSDDIHHGRPSSSRRGDSHVEDAGRNVSSPRVLRKRPRQEVAETQRHLRDENREEPTRLRDEHDSFNVVFQAPDQPSEYVSKRIDGPSTRVEEATVSGDDNDLESLSDEDEDPEGDEIANSAGNATIDNDQAHAEGVDMTQNEPEDVMDELESRDEAANAEGPFADIGANDDLFFFAENPELAPMGQGSAGVPSSEVPDTDNDNDTNNDSNQRCDPDRQGPEQTVANAPTKALSASDAAELVKRADEQSKDFFKLQDAAASPGAVYEMYEKAAGTNNIDALLRLAELNFTGAETTHSDSKRIERNKKRAHEFLSKVKKHSEYERVKGRALILEGDMLNEKTKKRDVDHALKLYQRASEFGANEMSAYKVGRWYYVEHFNQKAQRRKEDYLLKAVEHFYEAVTIHKSGDAAAYLAVIHENQNEMDYWTKILNEFYKADLDEDEKNEKAKELYILSADLGSPNGLSDLALCFQIGFCGMQKNLQMALHTFRQAFEKGCDDAAYNRAQLCREIDDDTEGEADYVGESFLWYKHGHCVRCPKAAHQLARIYNFGELREKRDVRKAIDFYEDAIKYASVRIDRNDVEMNAEKDLLALLVTCHIVNESASSSKAPKRKRDKLLKDARKQVDLITSATRNPEDHSVVQSAVNAPAILVSLLGKENMKIVDKHLKSPLLSRAL